MRTATPPSSSRRCPRVVVVGAGFGGLATIRALRKAPVDLLLIDRRNYFTFQPLLYQVATAALEPEGISYPIRGALQGQPNARFQLGTVCGVDWAAKQVRLETGERVPYDVLVLAAGATTHYMGVEGAEAHGFPLKSLSEAVRLRSHIIRQFECADRDPTCIEQGALNFVIVGAGPTGVETAGALVELFRRVLARDYPHLPVDRARVILVEGGPCLLAPFEEASQRHAGETLQQRGVELLFGERVVRVTPQAVELEGDVKIPTQTLIWAAGVRANPLADALGLEQTRGGRIVVNDDLSIPRAPDVFVVGDLAGSVDETERLHPQTAAVALQGGRHVARQVLNLLEDRPTTVFRYKNRGIMATVGRHAAVAELRGDIRLEGVAAWVVWLVLHLMMLVGFRNRLHVCMSWAWNYLTYDRSARHILDPSLEAPAAGPPLIEPPGRPAAIEIEQKRTVEQPEPAVDPQMQASLARIGRLIKKADQLRRSDPIRRPGARGDGAAGPSVAVAAESPRPVVPSRTRPSGNGTGR